MIGDSPVIEDAVTIVPVRDVAKSVEFYESVLGFECRFVASDKSFGTVVRGDAAVHLLATDDEGSLKATANHIAIYIWVKGVDALYAQLQGKLDKLPDGRVRAPFDQAYGMREFHVKDPDGCLLFFGEDISE